jgi:lysophospholipase L1-like esterase
MLIEKNFGIFRLYVLMLACTMSVCCARSQTKEQHWVGTWSTAPQLVEPHNLPPAPGLTNSTLRQVVRVSTGGDSLRVKFSSEFSSNPVTLKKVLIAMSTGGSNIDSATIKYLTFHGQENITIPPLSFVTSDPVAFKLSPRSDLAISIYFGQTSPDVTGHPGSRTTSYLIAGDFASSSVLSGATETDHWYVINGIDVWTDEKAAAIVILGNSITDGRGSGTNKQNRWPDILSEHLINNPATMHVAVLNQGIGGNCVLRSCLGPSAIDRFERDVLNQCGVRWLIILEGVNDIGQAVDSITAMQIAGDLIKAYTLMIDKAHARGILVYGATILPFGKSFYDNSFRQKARDMVNTWIRTSGRFDAVIDFDKIMHDPNDSTLIKPGLHTGDFLHPNEEGYKTMGETIDLKLFEFNQKNIN